MNRFTMKLQEYNTKEERLSALKQCVFIKLYIINLELHIDITKKQARKIIEYDTHGLKTNFLFDKGFLYIS